MFGELVRRAQHVGGLQGSTDGSESMRHLITQPARRNAPATHLDMTVEPELAFVMNQRHDHGYPPQLAAGSPVVLRGCLSDRWCRLYNA